MSHERQPYSNIGRVQNRCNSIDTHEILKQEIYKQGYIVDPPFRGLDGDQLINTAQNQTQIINQTSNSIVPLPVTGFEDTELYFDSVHRNNSDYPNGEVSWDIVSINGLTDINNCIEMHIGDFYFPKIYAPSASPEFFYFRRVFIEFRGAPSLQAVLGTSGNKFHFEMEVQNITGQAVRLVPIKKSFFFQRPLNAITNFRLKFSVPSTLSTPSAFKKIPIPPDTIGVSSTAVLPFGPLTFEVSAPYDTSVLGPIGPTGAPGIAIFMTGFYSLMNEVLIPQLNNPNGIYVTNIVDLRFFEVNFTEPPDADGYPCEIFIPKNRFAFPVRFTSVRNQATNYIDVNHS